jgi:hypothetical protein
MIKVNGGVAVSDTIEFEPADAGCRAWLTALVERANGGDAGAIAELRRFLDSNPALWRKVGDLTAHAEAAWRDVVAAGNELVRESVGRESDRLRAELLGERPTPVERLLVDQVVLTQLELRHRQLRAAEAPGVTPGQATSETKRLEGAQKRHLAAVKMLETVRKLTGSGTASPTRRVLGAHEVGKEVARECPEAASSGRQDAREPLQSHGSGEARPELRVFGARETG